MNGLCGSTQHLASWVRAVQFEGHETALCFDFVHFDVEGGTSALLTNSEFQAKGILVALEFTGKQEG